MTTLLDALQQAGFEPMEPGRRDHSHVAGGREPKWRLDLDLVDRCPGCQLPILEVFFTADHGFKVVYRRDGHWVQLVLAGDQVILADNDRNFGYITKLLREQPGSPLIEAKHRHEREGRS
jgi:hypothetical protein